MPACRHAYQRPHAPCPHGAAEGSELCLWHNPKVRKHEAYVPAVLSAAERAARGDMEGFRLAGLMWPSAVLPGRLLRDADLRDAVLDGADLAGADLAGACLRRCSLKRALLKRATLARADLGGANLAGADLREADLRDADLTGAALQGADLRGARLEGARLAGVQWSERTRLAGATGLPSEPAREEDDTRLGTAPFAALARRDETEESVLADPDPARDATRRLPVALPPTPVAAAPPRREHRAVLVALAVGGLVLGAGGIAATFLVPRATTAPAPVAAHDPAALRQQEEAYVGRIKSLEGEVQRLLDNQDRLQQEAQIARADAERLHDARARADAEAARLRGADDRAAMAALDLERGSGERERLARELARQTRLAAILAEGVRGLEAEREQLRARAETLAAAAERAGPAQTEAERARRELAQATAERDAARQQAATLGTELAAAREDLRRYLARVAGSGLEDYLATDPERLPLVALQPGKAVAFAGECTITLRVDPGARPGTFSAAVTLQRPSALATPDVALVLYDAERRPLRRIAYGFPHVDAGAPFASAATTVACERFPAYARLMVSPAVETAGR